MLLIYYYNYSVSVYVSTIPRDKLQWSTSYTYQIHVYKRRNEKGHM